MKKITTTETQKAITKESIEKILKLDTSKSAKIKSLFDLGMDVKDVAKAVDVRYNFVYNVVSNYARINGIAVQTSERGQKSKAIRELLKSGKTIAETSQITKTNYNQVWKLNKELKESGEIVTTTDKKVVASTSKPAGHKQSVQKAGPVQVSHIDPSPVSNKERAKAVAANASK